MTALRGVQGLQFTQILGHQPTAPRSAILPSVLDTALMVTGAAAAAALRCLFAGGGGFAGFGDFDDDELLAMQAEAAMVGCQPRYGTSHCVPHCVHCKSGGLLFCAAWWDCLVVMTWGTSLCAFCTSADQDGAATCSHTPSCAHQVQMQSSAHLVHMHDSPCRGAGCMHGDCAAATCLPGTPHSRLRGFRVLRVMLYPILRQLF